MEGGALVGLLEHGEIVRIYHMRRRDIHCFFLDLDRNLLELQYQRDTGQN